MTKLLYYITSLNIGGSEKFLCTLALSLKDEFEIEVAYIKDKGQVGKFLEDSGIKVVQLKNVYELYSYLKSNHIDVVHSFLYRANIISRITGLFNRKIKIICSQQAIDKWKPFYLRIIDVVTQPLAHLVMTNSQAAKASIMKRERVPENKIRVIYNAVKTANNFTSRKQLRKQLNIPDTAKVIAYAGRLHSEKGTDFIPQIASKVENAVFLIVGDGEQRRDIQSAIRANGTEPRFRFTGWINNVVEVLNTADIFIMPSREESFPQVLLEAMSQGLPAVAFDIGGVNELLIDKSNGFLVKYMDFESFTNAINKLLNDEIMRMEMGAKAKSLSERYSEQRMLNSVLAMYKELWSAI